MSEFRITNLEQLSFLSMDRKTVLDSAIDAGIIFIDRSWNRDDKDVA